MRKEVPGPPLMRTVNFDLVQKAQGRKFSSSLMPAVPARVFFNFFEADEQFH